jgi:Tfp pilus assembly protein PilN
MAQPYQRINLYRPVLGARTMAAPKRSWMIAGLAVLIMAVVAVLAMDLKKHWELKQEIAAQEVERDRVNGQLTTLADQLELLTGGMTAQVTVTSTELLPLISQRTKWVELFQDMSVRVPDGVWLSRMDVETMKVPKGRGRTTPADKKTIALSGFARSYPMLGQLLTALEQSPKFSSVFLKSAEMKADKMNEQVNFEITGELS